jgi:hypothetical protein
MALEGEHRHAGHERDSGGLPLNVLIEVFDELQANMIYSPGANRSTQGPKLENDAR